MRWERGQLRVLLELDTRRTTIDRVCELCSADLPSGTRVTSAGVVDRMEGHKYRWYLCDACRHFLEGAVEDSPPHVQQYLFSARFAEEVWDR